MFPSPKCACTGSALVSGFDCDHFLLFSSVELSSKGKPLLVTTIQENMVTRKILPGGRNDWTKVSEEKEEGGSLIVIHLTLRMVMAFQKSHMTFSIF